MGIFGSGKCVYVNTFGRLAELVLTAGQISLRNEDSLRAQRIAATCGLSTNRRDVTTIALIRPVLAAEQIFVTERNSLHVQKNIFPGRHLPRPATCSQIVIA
jgi:hypothetical protein